MTIGAFKKNPHMFDFPKIMGRVPLFLPVRSRVFKSQTIETSWGTVRFTGQALTTYDEDVFLALISLAKLGMFAAETGETFHTMIYRGNIAEIAKAALKKRGGKTYRKIQDSLAALKSISIDIKVNGLSIHDSIIYQYVIDENDPHKAFKVVINQPIARSMSRCNRLNKYVRQQLSPMGKSLHRFLSTHGTKDNKVFYCGLGKLRMAVAPQYRPDNFEKKIRKVLGKMVELGFLREFTLEGGVVKIEKK